MVACFIPGILLSRLETPDEHNGLRLVFDGMVLALSIMLWIWFTRRILDEIGWHELWLVPICTPLLVMLFAQILHWPMVEVIAALFIPLISIGLLIPRPRVSDRVQNKPA